MVKPCNNILNSVDLINNGSHTRSITNNIHIIKEKNKKINCQSICFIERRC